jgi:hypothetical protein
MNGTSVSIEIGQVWHPERLKAGYDWNKRKEGQPEL